jgi:pantoate--beta-alanine ligase
VYGPHSTPFRVAGETAAGRDLSGTLAAVSMRHVNVTQDIPATRAAIAAARRTGRRIGFVPTMGYLHDGHLSLMAAARRDETWVVVSIFVNPTQFGPNEDFERYPRDTAGDLHKSEAAGVELVFMPQVSDMYRRDATTTVRVVGLTDTLCGPSRPGHFDGVATVVAKLFNIVQPDRAYFGQKDVQQLAVIRRMVRDLDLPVEVVGCPIVREPDGLAMSSRNAMLSGDERSRAVALYNSLCTARDRVRAGEREATALTEQMRAVIQTAQPTSIDYISVVDPDTLQPLDRISGPVLVALAVRFGGTRLIDNLLIDLND